MLRIVRTPVLPEETPRIGQPIARFFAPNDVKPISVDQVPGSPGNVSQTRSSYDLDGDGRADLITTRFHTSWSKGQDTFTVEKLSARGSVLLWGDDQGRVYWEQRSAAGRFTNILDQNHDGAAEVLVRGLHGGGVTRFELDPAAPRRELSPVLSDSLFKGVRKLSRLPHAAESCVGSLIEAHRREDVARVDAILEQLREHAPMLANTAARVPIRVAAPGEPVRSVTHQYVDDSTAAAFDWMRAYIGIQSEELQDALALAHELIHAYHASGALPGQDVVELGRIGRELRSGSVGQYFSDTAELFAYFGTCYLAGWGEFFAQESPALHALLEKHFGGASIETTMSREDGENYVGLLLANFRGEA